MPTQEERLSALEKFQSLSSTHIHEVDENITILLGVVQKQGRDIRRTFQRLEIMDETLEAVEDQLKGVDQRLSSVEVHLGEVNGRLISVEGRLGTVEGRLISVENKLDQVLLLLNSVTTKPDHETE